MSFLCWGLQSWTQYSRWGLTRAEQRGRITSLDLLATLLMQPRTRLALRAASAHCQLMSSLSSISTPKSLSAELLSIPSSPSLYWYRGLPRPRCRTLYLALLNLMRFTQAHLSSLSRSLWMASRLEEAFLLSLTSLARFNSRWALSFFFASLHALAVFLYSSQVACPSFRIP